MAEGFHVAVKVADKAERNVELRGHSTLAQLFELIMEMMQSDCKWVLAVGSVAPMHDVDDKVCPGLLVEDAFQGCHVFVFAQPMLA